MKLLEKAVQCCDPKKVHLALLDMYVKSDQQQLGNELLDKMTKKFKKSCKVLYCTTFVYANLLERSQLFYVLIYWEEINYFMCNDRSG